MVKDRLRCGNSNPLMLLRRVLLRGTASLGAGETGNLSRAKDRMAGAMRGVGRRCAARSVVALLVLGGAFAASAGAEPNGGTSAAAGEAKPLPDRARAVLEVHCAECRAADGTLDLDALADDPRLVAPGRPDASRVYQRLLVVQAAHGGDAPSAPSPAEIETVRDWIEGLPARDAACRDRPFVTNGDVAALIAAWSRGRSDAEKADTRFLSLVHLWNACATPERLKDYNDALETLLAALADRREPPEVETLGEASAVRVVRLSTLGLVPAQWVRLMETAPRLASADAVPGDWLAARLLSEPEDAAGKGDPAFDVKFDAAGQRAVEKLARAWSRDVDLVRAAAERGVTSRALARSLANVGGEFLQPARRLIHGTLPRSAWESLSRALDGEAPPGSAESGASASETEIDVLLWTDKPVYRPRDLVTFNVSVRKACHLTLIDVDQNGKAIVLFPNELEPDNLVAPRVTVRVPGRDAEYQFRFDRSGEEQIVAICQRKQRRPEGIAYDYERQRFAILGDWRTFLRTIPERERKIREREAAEAARRKRRNRQPLDNGPPAVGAEDAAPIEGRTAITVTIEPGGT